MSKNYAHKSGNIVGQDGQTHNIVDLLGGGTPVSDEVHDIRRYAPMGGRVIGSDGKVYDLVELLQNISGGGGGWGGPVSWSSITGKPSAYPPETHDHDERYYTRSEIDSAGYLAANTDNHTIRLQGGELQAMSLSGLQFAVSQLNAWLAGTEDNIQSQFNDILLTLAALSAGMRYRGKFEAKADLDSVTIKDNGDLSVVLTDETRGGARSLYVFNDSLGMWDFIGAFEFADSFTALTDTPSAYDDGKLLRSGASGLYFDTPKWSEIDNRPSSTITQIDDAVAKRHEHNNADSLAKLGVNSDGELTINGVVYAPKTEMPVKHRLYARRTGTEQSLAAGTDCVFNTKYSGDISYSTSTGVFTLAAGKTYRIMVTASINTTGYVILQLVEADTNTVTSDSNRSIWMDVNLVSSSWHESSAGPLLAYVTPTVTKGYKIRAISVNGTAGLRQNFSALEIMEI